MELARDTVGLDVSTEYVDSFHLHAAYYEFPVQLRIHLLRSPTPVRLVYRESKQVRARVTVSLALICPPPGSV